MKSKEVEKMHFFKLLYGFEEKGILDKINLYSNIKMGFPVNDIQVCPSLHDNSVDVNMTFFGLYGVSSVLPPFMNELAIKNSDQGENFKDFLNIFQKRLYRLKYEVWKHGYGPFFVHSPKTPYAKILRSISGNKVSGLNFSLSYSIAGIIGKKSCSVLNLVNILQVLTGFSVSIKENIAQWIPYKRKIRENRLGENILLGKRYLDDRQLFCIKINCIAVKNIKKMYENKSLFKEIQSIMQLCLDPSLSCEFLLEATEGFFPISLAREKCGLGFGGILGCSSVQKPYTISLIYNKEFERQSAWF